VGPAVRSTSSRRASIRAIRMSAAGAVGCRRRRGSRPRGSRRGSTGLGTGLAQPQLAVQGRGSVVCWRLNPAGVEHRPFVEKATNERWSRHSVRRPAARKLGRLECPSARAEAARGRRGRCSLRSVPGAATRGPEMRSTGGGDGRRRDGRRGPYRGALRAPGGDQRRRDPAVAADARVSCRC